MNEPRDDTELDQWLAGDSPLSRRYAELGDEQPPEELDRKILASAAQASKVVPLERGTRRWGASIAVAATVLLCVSIVVNLSIQPEGPLLGEPPPQVEFADDSETARESTFADEPVGGDGRFDELRRRSQPAIAPPSVMEEVVIEPAPAASAPLERMTAAEPSIPERESLDAAIDPELARPSLAPPLATRAVAARDDELLARAVELLRARGQAGRAGLSAPVTSRQKTEQPGAPDDALDAILDAWDADDPESAWRRLQAFLRDNPDHPFTRELSGGN